jgi:putative transcriptional regulator
MVAASRARRRAARLRGDPTTLETVEHVRIFAGYAGWGAGQLEAEVAEEAWFVVAAETGDAFTIEPDRLWHEVLGRQRGELRLYRHFPLDPRDN